MEIYAVSSNYMAFSANSFLSEKEAEALARSILSEKLLPQWKNIHFDVFTAGDSALYLAYPEAKISIRLASYALPFIKEYFTE